MHLVLDTVSDDLPPTATYARRWYVWVPADPTHPDWDGRAGTLTIGLQAGRRAGCRVESDTYAVEDLGELFGLMGRAFVLTTLTDPTAADRAYEVRVGPLPGCTCEAGTRRPVGCKHTAALAALVESGALAGADTRAIGG